MNERFSTPVEAWHFLVAHGAIEVHGRDELLVEQLQTRLQPETPDIDTALRCVTMEGFLNAFFGLLGPFVRIMRDLLEYFERAGATQGPGQWVLTLGEGKDKLQVNLDHFRQWLKLFENQVALHPIPVLEFPKIWKLQSAFDSLAGRRVESFERPAFELERGLEDWLRRYEGTSWLPLPGVVSRTVSRAGSIGEYATLVHEIASAVSSVVPNYATLSRSLSRLREEAPPDIAEYVRNEHDRWVRTNVLNLNAYEHASRSQQREVEKTLDAMLKDVPRRPARFHLQMETLTEVLSLPIWKRRYELFSAWVFTRFLAALDGHQIELHDEDGCLQFAFRETLLATVRSLRKPLDVYAEKRAEAHGLRGHGRVSAIQPDYSAWTQGDGECKLAIECKHYKKASTANFSDALYDYSTNLPGAQVLLVNYGPVTAELMAITRVGGYNKRQFCWGNVNPEFPSQVEAFQQAIRNAIGDPLVARTTAAGTMRKDTVLVVDVSSSMKTTLTTPEGRQYILDLVDRWTATRLAAVDDALHGEFEPSAEGLDRLLEASPFGGTALLGPAVQLAQTYAEVFILTDCDGLSTLGAAAEILDEGPPDFVRSQRAIFAGENGGTIFGSFCTAGPLRLARLLPNT